MTAGQRAIRLALAAVMVIVARRGQAQTLAVTVPPGVSFNVIDVSASTSGVPNLVTVAYSNPLTFQNSQQLRISVRADSTTFTGPGTTHPAAASVSWTATSSSGTATNGTLSSVSYSEVYRSPTKLKPSNTGSASLHWTLAPIAAAGLRAGTHTLTVRWKFEAF